MNEIITTSVDSIELIEKRKQRLSILAEWTGFCNLSCPVCPINDEGMRQKGHMSLELWGNILESCAKEGNFVDWVHVLGEPLLWKNFFEGMKLWKESGLSKYGHISTNGQLLTDEKIECIAETGVSAVRICLDTMRPDVYKQIRGNEGHANLIANIHKFLEKAPNIECQIQLMKTKNNLDETADCFFKEFGYGKNMGIFVTECMYFGGKNTLTKERNIERNPGLCTKVNYEHCPITWDGKVGLCCADAWLHNSLGNYTKGSIRDIYCGEAAENIRRQIREGDYSSALTCTFCSMDHLDYSCQLVTEYTKDSRLRRLVRKILKV